MFWFSNNLAHENARRARAGWVVSINWNDWGLSYTRCESAKRDISNGKAIEAKSRRHLRAAARRVRKSMDMKFAQPR
jgi:hypothetical protein